MKNIKLLVVAWLYIWSGVTFGAEAAVDTERFPTLERLPVDFMEFAITGKPPASLVSVIDSYNREMAAISGAGAVVLTPTLEQRAALSAAFRSTLTADELTALDRDWHQALDRLSFLFADAPVLSPRYLLSTGQQQQLAAIHLEVIKATAAVHEEIANIRMTREAYQARWQTHWDAMNQKVDNILTPEQRQAFESMQSGDEEVNHDK